jgi:hypothetical protein
MHEPLKRLIAEAEIRDQLSMYCRGIDRLDGEAVRDTHHEDAWIDHGTAFRGGPDDYVAYVIPRLTRYQATTHALHQSIINFQNDSFANAETYVLANLWLQAEDSGSTIESLGARYVDRWEKRSGTGWRLLHRIVVLDWRSTGVAKDLDGTHSRFAHGRHGRDDFAYLKELPKFAN